MKHFIGFNVQGWRHVRVRVFAPWNASSKLINVHAGRGKAYSDEDVDKLLDGVANDIEKNFPGHEYECVALGQAHFNFVWRAERKPQPRQPQASA